LTSISAPLLPGANVPASRHPNDDRGMQCAGISCRFWPVGLSRLPGTRPRPETTSARFGGAFRFPWPFGVARIDRCSPRQTSDGRFWQTHWRRPETVSLAGVGRFAWDNSQAGRWAIADSACRPKAATRNFTGKNQRPVRSEMIRMWLRRVMMLHFPGSHGRIGPYDRGYRLELPLGGDHGPKTAGP
jgi:hypothetical protein